MKYTVIGGQGFIGSRVSQTLRQRGHTVEVPHRTMPLAGLDLGQVVWCAGLTSDFRTRPLETMEAHVCALVRLLSEAHFDKLIYLSSARVYRDSTHGAESTGVTVNSAVADDFYNISKLAGEAVTLHSKQGRGCVLRLSNVFGAGGHANDFIHAVSSEARDTGQVHFQGARNVARDFIPIEDASELIATIAESGLRPIYNVASGTQVSNQDVADLLRHAGIASSFSDEAASFPHLNVEPLKEDFGYAPDRIKEKLGAFLYELLAGRE